MNILRHLGDLKLYDDDRKNGIIPALLVDGNVSRFDMVFLKYICNENQKRTVVFVVPYITEQKIQNPSC